MTPSFLILGWKTAVGCERARALAAGWSPGLATIACDDRLIVLAAPGFSRSSPSSGPVLLGPVYGDAPERAVGLAGDMLRRLVRQTWGNYLEIACDPQDCLVMVDPSGAGRAHMASDGDIVLVTDALTPALMRVAGLPIAVDTAALAGCLMDPGTMVSAPLLTGVVPMIAGVAYSLDGTRQPEPVWTPSLVEEGSRPRDSLRLAVDRAVSGMLASRGPLIELSGGLDSSIVAGTMTDLGMRPRAVNVELIGGDVDELRYARATADRCGLDLHTERVADYPDLGVLMAAGQTAHPFLYGVDAAFSGAVGAAPDSQIDCVVTGQGGDAVFLPAGDRLHDH